MISISYVGIGVHAQTFLRSVIYISHQKQGNPEHPKEKAGNGKDRKDIKVHRVPALLLNEFLQVIGLLDVSAGEPGEKNVDEGWLKGVENNYKGGLKPEVPVTLTHFCKQAINSPKDIDYYRSENGY